MTAVGREPGEIGASPVLDGEGAQAERAHVRASGKLGFVENLAPRINGVAGERGRDVPRAVQSENVESIGEPIEAQGAGDGDDVAAIDEPPAEPALAFDMLIEMDARRVLEQARGELMLGLFDRLPVNVVDLVADGVVVEAPGRAGKRIVVA